jgi:hypothetical protein
LSSTGATQESSPQELHVLRVECQWGIQEIKRGTAATSKNVSYLLLLPFYLLQHVDLLL